MELTEAEKCFFRATGVKVNISPVSPDLTLDLDSYSDLRRLSALYFHRLRTSHDLETDLKEFVKGKKRERRETGKIRGGGV
jgi:hypothetical protein